MDGDTATAVAALIDAGRIPVAFRRHLPAIVPSVRPKRTEACVHLGDEKGRRLCAGCQGHVELIVYACAHPAHGETTIANCQRCGDHEARDG